jgi:hypothetical protein
MPYSQLPVSVIVPHQRKRTEFFRQFCLPSIEANRPGEILVEPNEGGSTGAKYRNIGIKKARFPLVAFVDDDVVLAKDFLWKLFAALMHRDWKRTDYAVPAFAYCDYHGICFHPTAHPAGPIFRHEGRVFDHLALRRGNFISTMSLVIKEYLPKVGWDETLSQYDDWDFWLSLWDEHRAGGIWVNEPLFHAYYLDPGLSVTPSEVEFRRVQVKHNIPVGQ